MDGCSWLQCALKIGCTWLYMVAGCTEDVMAAVVCALGGRFIDWIMNRNQIVTIL